MTPSADSPASSGPVSALTLETVVVPFVRSLDPLASQVAAEMIQAWRGGRRLGVEEWLSRHPTLRGQRDAVLRLVCEELCLRREASLAIDADDFARRFPEWSREIQALLECQRILEPEDTPGNGPVADARLRDLRIVTELGRGGQGRVFLATQPQLADRPVVVKITPRRGYEHLSLARLQHTHIVPLYWVKDLPEDEERILCMPFFGTLTLAGLFQALADVPPPQRTGRHILALLDQPQPAALPAFPDRGPARQLLARATYVQAIAWMGSCLAGALHYAHERDLVHLDLKPSNVLWTTEGQPMLLDFHLARPPFRPSDPRPQGLGGTPLYMSPEQAAAWNALGRGQAVPQAVDGRSDIYSLGLVLYQALGGPVPFPAAGAPRLETCNPRVSLGLADILHKCLAHAPEARYQAADDLAQDLLRHLGDLPLRGAPNRSWQERWHKWRRRRPHALASAALVGVLALVLVGAGLFGWLQHRSSRHQQELAHHEAGERLWQADQALSHGRLQIEAQKFDLALATLDHGLALVPDSAEGRALAQQLREQRRLAQGRQAAQLLHEGVNALRRAAVADSLSFSQRAGLEQQCRLLWARRDRIWTELPLQDARTRSDVIDLAVIWSDLRLRLARTKELPSVRRDLLAVLAEVEHHCGYSALLDRARQAHAQALGIQVAAPAAGERPFSGPQDEPPWEQVAQARALIQTRQPGEDASFAAQVVALGASWPGRTGLPGLWVGTEAMRLQAAARLLEQVLGKEPQNFWASYYQGICAYRLHRPREAVEAFRVCLALAPDQAATYYNRALAYTQAGNLPRAVEDYTRALDLDPALGAAALNRALLHARLGDLRSALADLHLAASRGADPVAVRTNFEIISKKSNPRKKNAGR
jgi:serine/threonine protein kinase